MGNLLYVFVSFFGPDRAQCSIAFLSFWTYWPTETSHQFIQSQFMNKQTKDCAWPGSFQHKLHHHCFQLWCLPAFLTSLLYKLWTNQYISDNWKKKLIGGSWRKYSKHPHIRTNGLRTPGWNLANKAPFLQEQDKPENCNMFL